MTKEKNKGILTSKQMNTIVSALRKQKPNEEETIELTRDIINNYWYYMKEEKGTLTKDK